MRLIRTTSLRSCLGHASTFLVTQHWKLRRRSTTSSGLCWTSLCARRAASGTILSVVSGSVSEPSGGLAAPYCVCVCVCVVLHRHRQWPPHFSFLPLVGEWHYYYTALGDMMAIFNSAVNFVIYVSFRYCDSIKFYLSNDGVSTADLRSLSGLTSSSNSLFQTCW